MGGAQVGLRGPAGGGGFTDRSGAVQQSIRPAGNDPGGEGDFGYMEHSKKLGTFYGVGVGPGDPELLTLKAVRVLEEMGFRSAVIEAMKTCEEISKSL